MFFLFQGVYFLFESFVFLLQFADSLHICRYLLVVFCGHTLVAFAFDMVKGCWVRYHFQRFRFLSLKATSGSAVPKLSRPTIHESTTKGKKIKPVIGQRQGTHTWWMGCGALHSPECNATAAELPCAYFNRFQRPIFTMEPFRRAR